MSPPARRTGTTATDRSSNGRRRCPADATAIPVEGASIEAEPQPVAGSDEPTAPSGPTTPEPVVEPVPPTARSIETRLARLHLRTGLLSLARAELETLAGQRALDVPALADLAEARWRSGDLSGASEAARAHADAGGREPMARLIEAEGLAAEGHLSDARAVAAAVASELDGRLDGLFAGQPRSSIWPLPPPPAEGTGGDTTPPTSQPTSLDVPDASPSAPEAQIEAGLDTAAELERAEALLADGQGSLAISRLSLLLRARGSAAPAILMLADRVVEELSAAHEIALLHLLRGDAYRLLGREIEAQAAYAASQLALEGPTSEETA